MKFTVKSVLVMFIAVLAGCEVQNTALEGLPGKWKLVENWGSIGAGEQVKMEVKENTFIEFSADGKLSGSGAQGFERYRVTDSTIVFIRSDNTEQNYSHKFEDNRLSMSPAGPMYCIEGCRYVYKKVN